MFLGAILPAALPAADPSYLAELQARAGKARLSASTAWMRLLHAQGGDGSTIDFPGFFLAATGKHDADAELQATLAAFFDDAPLYEEPRQCRFKARYEWLKEQLTFDPARLPAVPCERYAQWHRDLAVGGVTLVFASNDLGSPSSMFGHTLLRLDAQGAAGDQRLLGYAVNYAAQTTREAGVLYALKGLTGFYQGLFGVMPYYDKVKEYERFEHRDLWEYRLLLDQAASERLLWHLWELRGVSSDYYFFSENCSYQLLSLLEVAVPQAELTARFRRHPRYTIPVDSVRALGEAGLLDVPVFRPANAHRLQHRYAELPDAARDWVLDTVDGGGGPEDPVLQALPPEQRAGALEVGNEALYFHYQQRELGRTEGLPRSRALLAARARLDAASRFSEVPLPAASPDQGHRGLRLGLGARRSEGGDGVALLGARPAYHDRLDPSPGYLAGGELEFLGGEVAVRNQGLRLDSITLLNVQAVAPRSDLFRPWSWFASTGGRRALPLNHAPGAFGGYGEGGGGLSWAPLPSLRLFGFGQSVLEANSDYRRGHDLGLGARMGMSGQLAAGWTGELRGDWLRGVSGDGQDRQGLRAAVQASAGVDSGLRLEWRLDRRRPAGRWQDEAAVELRWLGYF